jgi:hypothetical protein
LFGDKKSDSPVCEKESITMTEVQSPFPTTLDASTGSIISDDGNVTPLGLPDDTEYRAVATPIRQERKHISKLFTNAWKEIYNESNPYQDAYKATQFADKVISLFSSSIETADEQWVRPLLIAWAQFWHAHEQQLVENTFSYPSEKFHNAGAFVDWLSPYQMMANADQSRNHTAAVHDLVRLIGDNQITDTQINELKQMPKTDDIAPMGLDDCRRSTEGHMICASNPFNYTSWQEYMNDELLPLLAYRRRSANFERDFPPTSMRTAFTDIRDALVSVLVVRKMTATQHGKDAFLDRKVKQFAPVVAHMLHALDNRYEANR